MLATITRAAPAERDEVHAFWYRIYVQEMKRLLDDPLTDHQQKRVFDPLADFGNLFIARNEDGQVVGTVLSTCAGKGRLGKYEQLYGLTEFDQAKRSKLSITTKLMVDPKLRRTRLALLMARRGYELLLEQGMDQDYIDCNDHLVPFFEKLGYLPHLGRIEHPAYGSVNSMVINLRDAEHLKAVGSPFLRALPKTQPAAAEVETQRIIKEAKDHAAA